jgi:hypothetical protein
MGSLKSEVQQQYPTNTRCLLRKSPSVLDSYRGRRVTSLFAEGGGATWEPNWAFEPTRTGSLLSASISFLASSHLPVLAAQLRR